jgi:hypothetical protein
MSLKLEGRVGEVFGGLSTKEEVMHRVVEFSHLLSNIPLPEPITPYEQAHKDFRRERILFNQVPFVPDTTDVNRMHAFSHTITEFVTRICGGDRPKRGGAAKTGAPAGGGSTGAVAGQSGYKGGPSSAVYDRSGDNLSARVLDTILRRACRTSAGVDSFFMVQKLLAVEGTLVTQKPVVCDPPIRIDAFLIPFHIDDDATSTEVDSESASSDYRTQGKGVPLGCRVEVHNFFAVYNLSSMDGITGDSGKDPPPWLEVETIVIDETNFLTSHHHRKLQLIVYCPATDKYYPPLKTKSDD